MTPEELRFKVFQAIRAEIPATGRPPGPSVADVTIALVLKAAAEVAREAGRPDRHPKPPGEFDRGWQGCADVIERRLFALGGAAPSGDAGTAPAEER